MKNKGLIIWFTALILVLIFCFYNIRQDVKAETYTETVKVYLGSTKTLKIYTDDTITWTSSKPSVATVSSKGKIIPKKNGKTIITAKTSEDTYEYEVYVCIKYTEDEVTEILSETLTGTVKEVSKSIFYSNPQTKVKQLKDIRIGDYLKINGTLYIVVNKTTYRLTVYDGNTKFNMSYNRVRAQSNIVIYTRY